MRIAFARKVLGTAALVCLTLGALGAVGGCARFEQRPSTRPSSAETTPAPAASVKRANRVDVAAAQEVVLAYIDALNSRDATEAAALMTSYRRGETRSKGWKADIGWWKSARVKAVMNPGRYLSDERTFALLYAEHFGHLPYKLVVFNVSYGLGPGVPPGDTDFVVTRDSAGAPWLVHEFGGALRPEPAAPSKP